MFFDEAQYWYWSQNLSWGYFSKPPMVAWLISLTTSVCGDGESCVRLASPILHSVTSIIIYFTAYELYKDKRTAVYSSIAYLTLPAVSVSSALISTDPPLLMFWALAMFFFVEAIKKDSYKCWILAGISAGLGMMSKYNMLIFLFSAIFYMSMSASNRKYFLSKGFWSACFIAGIIFLPNVMWNFDNGLVSFLHTKENASGSGIALYPENMLEFIAAQFGVFGPIFFASLLIIIYKFYKDRRISDANKLLLCFVLPLFLVIISVSLLSRAHANWAAPIYVPATILVVAWLVKNAHEKWIKASLFIHVFVALLMSNFYLIDKIPNVDFVGGKTAIVEGKLHIKDPFKRLYGWKDLGEGVKVLRKAYPEARILTDSRKIHSEILYYARPEAFHTVKWNPEGKMGDHFDLTTDINKAGTKDFIYITTSDSVDSMADYFESVERVGNIHISPYDDFAIDYYAYYMTGFKGYDISPL
jgi:4-amino-4-deoxy-L-arabinose transferase-like glycosyltransferase